MNPLADHPALEAVRRSGSGKVKVAVSDIDGILRGKYLHLDKFTGAAQPHPAGGFGFCDVVFGWDAHDVTYDNTTLTGWQPRIPWHTTLHETLDYWRNRVRSSQLAPSQTS